MTCLKISIFAVGVRLRALLYNLCHYLDNICRQIIVRSTHCPTFHTPALTRSSCCHGGMSIPYSYTIIVGFHLFHTRCKNFILVYLRCQHWRMGRKSLNWCTIGWLDKLDHFGTILVALGGTQHHSMQLKSNKFLFLCDN